MDVKPATYQNSHSGSDEEKYDVKPGALTAGLHGMPADPDEGLSPEEKAKIVSAQASTFVECMLTRRRTKRSSAGWTTSSFHG